LIRRLLLLSLVFLAACTPTNVGSQPTPTAAPPPPGLGLDQVLGLYYQPYETMLDRVQLENGIYRQSDPPMQVSLSEDWIVFGDLNADETGDAAALVIENFGGSGQFYFLVVLLYEKGQPRQLFPVLLGDRVQLQGFRAEGSMLTVDLLVQGPADPLCCPTVPYTWTYLVLDPQVFLLRSSSRTPTGMERAIIITHPLMETEFSQTVRLAGNVTISPFENNLVCRIYRGSTLIQERPLMVASADIGAPGTFDSQIDLSAIPPGELVRIEVLDISMADGSILASDSILFFSK